MSQTNLNVQGTDLAGSGDAPSSERESAECKTPIKPVTAVEVRLPVSSARRFNARTPIIGKAVKDLLQQDIGKLESLSDKPKRNITRRKRSLTTMSDISPKVTSARTPRATGGRLVTTNKRNVKIDHREKLLSQAYAQVEGLQGMRRRELITRCFTAWSLYLWRKKTSHNEELQKHVNQLQLQNSFLHSLREKESVRRSEAAALVEQQSREVEELHSELKQAKEKCEAYERVTQNLEVRVLKLQSELEISNNEHRRLNVLNCDLQGQLLKEHEMLAELRKEKQTLLDKILQQENIVNQQEFNVEKLHKIAEELDVRLKEQVAAVATAYRDKEEATENAAKINHENEVLIYKLKESLTNEKKCKREKINMQRKLCTSDNKNLETTLENCTLKTKLDDLEEQLQNTSQKLVESEEINTKQQLNWNSVIYMAVFKMLLNIGILTNPILPQKF